MYNSGFTYQVGRPSLILGLFCFMVGEIVHSSSGFQHGAIDVVQKCSGHLPLIVLMARALKKAFNLSIWEHASYILSLPHRAQMKDRVLCNAVAFILGRSVSSSAECVKYCTFHMERKGMNKVDLILNWMRHALISTFD